MSNCRRLDTALANDDMREFSYRLMNERLYLPDILHDTKSVMDATTAMFRVSCQPFALVNGDNRLGGVFFISDVVPGHEAVFYSWVWNPQSVTATTLPFMREYIDAGAEEYSLCRIVARTPDKKLCHLLEHLGFTQEGRFKSGYKSDGRLHTLFQYRKLYGR